MDKAENLFFELLQIAIGNRKTLSHILSNEEWKSMFEMAKKQSLVAIAFRALSKLKDDDSSDPYEDEINQTKKSKLAINEMVYLKWLGLSAKISQRNKVVTEECVLLAKRLAHDGFHSCILKGQSNLVDYPEDLRECRTPGDIDVLIRSMEEPDAIDLPIRYCITQCHLHDVPVGKICYHHMDMPWEGTIEVEAHHRATWLNSPLRNRRLQNWLEDNMPFMQATAPEGFSIPTNSYNAIYQLLHIYKHMFEEGIGLRQLLDYYFVLRTLHIEQGELADMDSTCSPTKQSMAQWAVLRQAQKPEKDMVGERSRIQGVSVASKDEIMYTLGRFGMKKFAGAVMWVLAQVFDPRGDKTKTIKTPDGSVSVAVSENSSELDLSVTASSTDSVAAPVQPSGDKQEINHSSVVNDWQSFDMLWNQRWPWMICEPNEKEGKFLLNEIMMAGNFGKYDERIKRCYRLEVSGYRLELPMGMVHAIEKTKHNLRLLTHYPEEVLSEPFFRLYHWIWRRLELWRY